jgi:formylmethanofuran dehydrogenase subunit E
MAEIAEIGVVRSRFTEPADPFEMRKHESTIVLNEDLEDGLFRIEESGLLQVLFHFHLAAGYELIGTRYHGERKGVFASRSPRRPGRIGLSTVELVRREGRTLVVKGLDAVDGTPVLDIKPYVPSVDRALDLERDEEKDRLRRRPRDSFVPLIRNRDLRELLRRAGSLHGHFCPGVSMGVTAAVCGLHRLAEERRVRVSRLLASDGLEELLAMVETNSCFSDGVQVVTGCTFGNNALIFLDLGKTAVTLTDRSGDGVRVAVRSDYRAVIDEKASRFSSLFDEVIKGRSRDEEKVRLFKEASAEASFRLLEVEPGRLFTVEVVHMKPPAYAPILESDVCARCGENVMRNRTVAGGRDGQQILCLSCASASFRRLTGEGIE